MVGFIGLGRMGKPMARALLRAGFPLTVHSRSPGPVEELAREGAAVATSPAEVSKAADIVLTCLPDTAACELVYFGDGGLVSAARPGQVFVETSTIGPKQARATASALADRGAGYLDAPVSGGVERAADATLTIMAGGEEEHFRRVLPVLQALGTNVQHVGGVGQGCIFKLTNQLLVCVHTLAACEAMLVGLRAGARGDQLLDVLSTSWGNSAMLARTAPMIMSGEYGSRAPMRLLAKDMALVEEVAAELGIKLPLGHRTRVLLDEAMARGMSEDDLAAIARLL